MNNIPPPRESLFALLGQLLSTPHAETACREHGLTPEQVLAWLKRLAIPPVSLAAEADGTKSPFELLVESIPHAVFAKDLDGRFIYGNPAYCSIQGITLTELAGTTDFDIHPPEFARKYREDDRNVIQKGEIFRAIEENALDGRETIWTGVVKAPIHDEQGSITGVIGMFWDITEQAKAEEALRASEANLRRLIEHAPLPICVLSLTGDIKYLNAAFMELFGYTRQDAPTLDALLRLVCPPDSALGDMADKMRNDFFRYARKELSGSKDYVFMGLDHEQRHIQVTGSVLKDEVVLMMTDITKLKAIEDALLRSRETLELTVEKRTQELIEANMRLEDINKLKTTFLSSVSHELRTPLTSILGFAQMISRDISKLHAGCEQCGSTFEKHTSRMNENAAIIAEEGRRLKRLIDNLLDFSKIESGQMAWNDEEFDLAHIAREAVKAMQGQFAGNPGVTLTEKIPSGPVRVMADPDRIMQVFINLLHNAAKFTDKGQVSVAVEIKDGTWAEGCVKDTGPGISQRDLDHIFEKYYQGFTSSTRHKGTGLGLSISRQIVTHYKGKFWVESAPGLGSSFFFRLPLAA